VAIRAIQHVGGAGTRIEATLGTLYQRLIFRPLKLAQVGTAFAARTERASLRSVGAFSNPLLLAGIGAELALAAAIIYVPILQELLGTAALPAHLLLITVPFPFIVWGADEIRRYLARRRRGEQLPA
jgi:magnesium-transporting ATPase (P-type)